MWVQNHLREHYMFEFNAEKETHVLLIISQNYPVEKKAKMKNLK